MDELVAPNLNASPNTVVCTDTGGGCGANCGKLCAQNVGSCGANCWINIGL